MPVKISHREFTVCLRLMNQYVHDSPPSPSITPYSFTAGSRPTSFTNLSLFMSQH